jgi:DNA (cytosine-5)-methyltransferase 1
MRPRILDLFCGEGGAGMGYFLAGWDVFGVDNDPGRLGYYPFPSVNGDALVFLAEHGAEFDAIHASPPCTGYSRGTAALPDRLTRYDRLIAATRDLLVHVGRPYVIENVNDARPELVDPIKLCGRMFDLTAVDTDGVKLTLDRHRLFEAPAITLRPEHRPHGWRSNAREGIQVAGAYGGARRDKHEARHVRKGGYVPASLAVQRALLGTPWMSEKGCHLSIPPAYSQWVGTQLLEALGGTQ